MKYLIQATSNKDNIEGDFVDVAIPIEINIDGERANTAIIIDLGEEKTCWIPISEIDHLLYIIKGLTD